MSTPPLSLPPRPSAIGASGTSPATKRGNSAGTPTNMSRINSGNAIPRPSSSAGQTPNRQHASIEERRGSTASSDLSASLNSPLTARPNRVPSVTLKSVDTPLARSDGSYMDDAKNGGRNVGGNDTNTTGDNNFLGLNSDSMVASIRRGGEVEVGEELLSSVSLSPISKAASVRGQQPATLGSQGLVLSAIGRTVASAAVGSPSPHHKVDQNPHDFLSDDDYSSLRPNTDTSLATAPSYSATHKVARQNDTFAAYDNTTTTAHQNTESVAFNADAPWPETLHDRVLRTRLAISDLFDHEYERSNYDGAAPPASRKASLMISTRPASSPSSSAAVGLSEERGRALVSGVHASVPNALSIAQNKAHLKLLRSRVVHILHQLADSVRVDDAVSEGLEEVLRNSNISQTLIDSSSRSAGMGLGPGAGGSAHRLLEGKSSSSRKGLDAGGSGGRALLRPLTTGSERGLGAAGAGVASSARHDLIMANVRVKLSEKIREIEALKAFCKRKDIAIDSIRGALLQDVINLKKENIELTSQVANLQTALQKDQQTAGRATRTTVSYVSSHKGDERNGTVPLDATVPMTSYESTAPASASPASHGLGSPNMSTTFLTATATSATFAGNTLQMQQTAAREYLTIFDYLRLFEGDDPDPERQEGGALRIAERHHREVVQRLNLDNTNQILLKDREIELLRREIDHLNGEVVSALNKKYVPANSYLMYRLALMRASRFGGKSGAAAMALAVQLGQNEVDVTAKLSRERRRESTDSHANGGAKEAGEEEREDSHTVNTHNNLKMENLWDPVAKAPYGVVLPEGIVIEAVGPRTGEELENDLVFVMRELDKKVTENSLLNDRLEREKVEGSSRAANERASLLREQQAAQELTSQLEERETECAQLQETVATLQRALADATNPNKRDEKGQIQKAAEMESILRMNVELQSETIPRITKERDSLASVVNELRSTIEQLKADAALAAADAEGANDNALSDLSKSGPQQLAALVKNNAVLSRQAQRAEQELKQSQQRLDDERQKVEALQNELNEARAEMALRGKTASGNNLLLLARRQSTRRPSMQSDSAQTPTNGGGDKDALSIQIAELEDQMQFLKEEKKEQEDEARRMAKKIELLEGHLRTSSESTAMGDGSDPSSTADNKGAKKGSDVKEMRSVVYSLQKENTDLHTEKMTLEQKTETLEAKNLDLLNEVQLLKTQLMLEKNRTAALTTPKPTETTVGLGVGDVTSSSSFSTTTQAGKKGNGAKDRNKLTKPTGVAGSAATTVTTKRGATTITAPSGRTAASASTAGNNSKVSKKDLAVSDFNHQETLIEPPAGSVNTATSSSIRHASASQRERSAASGGVAGNKGRDVKVAEESEVLLSEEGRKASVRAASGEGPRSSPSARKAAAAIRGGGDGVDVADDDLTYYATIRNEDGGAGFEDEDEDDEFDDFDGIGGRPSSRGLGHKGSPRGGVGVRSRLGGSGTRIQTHDNTNNTNNVNNSNNNLGVGGFQGTYFYGEEIPASAALHAGFVGIGSTGGPLSNRQNSALSLAGKVGNSGSNSSNNNNYNKAILAGGMAARPLSSSSVSLLSHPSSQLTSGRKVAGTNTMSSLSSASLKSGTIAKTALPEVTAVLGEGGEETSTNSLIQGKAKDSSISSPSSDDAQIIKTRSSAVLVGNSGSASVQIAAPVGGFGGDGGAGTPAITAMGRPQSAAGLLAAGAAAGGGGSSSDRSQAHLLVEREDSGGTAAAKKGPTAVDLLSGLPPPRVASASNRMRGGITVQKGMHSSRPPSPASATTVVVESRRSVLGEKDGDLFVTKDKHHYTPLGSASSSGNKNKRLLPPSSAGENGKTTSTVLYQGFAPMAARDISSSAHRRPPVKEYTGDTGETHGLHSSATAVIVVGGGGGGLPPLSSHSLDESSSRQLPNPRRELADTSTQTDFSLFVNESDAVTAEQLRGGQATRVPLNNTIHNTNDNGKEKSGGVSSAGSLGASDTSYGNNRSTHSSQQRLSYLIAPPNNHLSPPQPSDLHPRYTVASRFGVLHHNQSGLGVYGPSPLTLSSSPSRMVRRNDAEGADDVEGSHAPKREQRPSPVASSFASSPSALAPPPQAGGLFVSEAEAAEAVDSVFAPSPVLQKYWALQWIRQHSDQFVRHYQDIISQQQHEQQRYHQSDIRYMQSQQRAATAGSGGGGVSQPNAKPILGDSDIKSKQANLNQSSRMGARGPSSESSASFLATSASYLTKTDKERAAQSFQWLGKEGVETEGEGKAKLGQNDDTLQRQKVPSPTVAGDTPADPKKESHFYEPDGANHTILPTVFTAKPKHGDDPSVELALSNPPSSTTCTEGNEHAADGETVEAVATSSRRPLAESISKIEQRHGGGARGSSASSRPTSRPSSAAGPSSTTSAPLVFPPSAHVLTSSGGSGPSSPTTMSRPASATSGAKPLAANTDSVSKGVKDQQRREIDSTLGKTTNLKHSDNNVVHPAEEDTAAAAAAPKPNWRSVVRNAEIECQKAEIELDEHLRAVGRDRQAKQLAAMAASRSRSPTKRFDSSARNGVSGSGTNAAERRQGSYDDLHTSPSPSSSPPSLSTSNIPFRNALAFGPTHSFGSSDKVPLCHGTRSPEAMSMNAPLPLSDVDTPQAGAHGSSSFSFSTSGRGISRGGGGGASSTLDIRMLTKDIYHVDDLLPEDAALERRIAASAAVRRTRGASGAGDGDPNGGGTAGRKQRQAAGGATASVRGVREKVQAQINVAKFMQTFPDLHPLPRQSPNSHAPVKPTRK